MNDHGTHPIELALCQINPVVGDLVGNAELAIEQAAAAVESGAELVVFPELALCGYPPEDLVFREDFVAAAEVQLRRIAASIGPAPVLIGFPQAFDGGVANALAVLESGRISAVYRKRLLPNYGVFDERRHFAAGDENVVVELAGRRVGLSICEDVWFDDPVFSGLAAAGAELVVNASASPFHLGKPAEREQMLRDRARRYGIPVAYCNICGGQDELVFDGTSVVIDAAGDVVARAPDFESTMLRCGLPLDPKASRPAGHIAAPPHTPEEEAYTALLCGIRDYVGKNGFPGALVGVSGGIDSALVLTLACDALGPEVVTGVSMPSPYNTAATRNDALELIGRLGCSGHEFAIDRVMDAFTEVLAGPFAGTEPDQTEENIQARIRGTLLMGLSNKFGSLVLTTGNKSEMAVGYATLYGDMAGGFAPLKDVPKQMVFALCRWRNANLPHSGAVASPIPDAIIERPPSAELRHGQTDEATLGSYAVLDDVLERYIERDQGVDEIVSTGVERSYVERIVRLVDLAEYKRRQAPPGVKITPRAFGRDRRMPITARRRYT